MKRRIKYNLRLFLVAVACIWAVLLGFAYLVVREEHKFRRDNIVERIDLAASCIADAQTSDNDLRQTISFVKNYLDETYLSDIVIRVYDLRSRKLISTVGDGRYAIPHAAFEHGRVSQSDGTRLLRLMDDELGVAKKKLYYYSSRITADGALGGFCGSYHLDFYSWCRYFWHNIGVCGHFASSQECHTFARFRSTCCCRQRLYSDGRFPVR